jgi:hypothetical protein
MQLSTIESVMSAPINPNQLFYKIVLKTQKDGGTGKLPDQLPEGIELRGCIAFTKDTRRRTLFNIMVSLAQKLHAFIFNRKDDDTNVCHGFLIMNCDDKRPNNLIISHSTIKGIRTTSRNYLIDPAATEIVIYVPKEKALRDLIERYGHQTAYTDPAFRTDGNTKNERMEMPKFSFKDLISSIFHKKESKSSKVKKRTSYVVTDLLMGQQIKNRLNRPKPFFCSPYVLSVLQVSLLLKQLSEEQKFHLINQDGQPLDRNAIAKSILGKIETYDEADPLSKSYFLNRICRLDARFAPSCYTARALDKVSQEVFL